MGKPNLFIVGAPKCGTTSIAYWLGEHPQVFLPAKKEPHFFNRDMKKGSFLKKEVYESYFENAGDELYWVDASTRYLYSEVAIKNILRFNPNAYFVAMVRNPVDLVVSLHNHLFEIGVEPEKSLEKAWHLQERRKKSRFFYRWNRDPESVQYKRIAAIGSQIERMANLVPQEQRLIVIFDDIEHTPEKVYQDTLAFLGLKRYELRNFLPKNTAFTSRSRILNRVVNQVGLIKNSLGFRRGLGVLNALDRLNRKNKPEKTVSTEFRGELMAYFEDEVEKVRRITGRDLNGWEE